MFLPRSYRKIKQYPDIRWQVRHAKIYPVTKTVSTHGKLTHITSQQEQKKMSEIEVKIVKLEPMRMVSAYGFGAEPESIAWGKINAFTENNNIDLTDDSVTTYGFNNPNPSKGSPNYGYEIWLPITAHVKPEGDLRVVDFTGGLYAVTNFKGLENIGKVWQELVKWREGSKYKPAYHQWLEELLTYEVPPEEFIFNLYLPIAE
jgi:effector-binding domain-containing protein